MDHNDRPEGQEGEVMSTVDTGPLCRALGLEKIIEWMHCDDPQCGDSTWDHDCGEGTRMVYPPIHESEKWAVRAMEEAVLKGCRISPDIDTSIRGNNILWSAGYDTDEGEGGIDHFVKTFAVAVFLALEAARLAGAFGEVETEEKPE